jgi:flagellar hook-associated protein 2
MTIQSLGVGSGLDLEGLVTQLLEAERKPKQERLDKKQESFDAQISSLGQLKSKMKSFLDSVDELRAGSGLRGREPTIENPTESIAPFTAEASNSAVEANYKIAVTQVASGSRIETKDASAGGFTGTSDTVLSSGSGSLTFKIPNTTNSFTVNVNAGMTVQQLSNAINKSSTNFGVTSSIIDTGTVAGGAKLVFSSSITGQGNDLEIVNNNDLADLQRVSTTNSAENTPYLTPIVSAKNSKATIDGIAVESKTDKFENTIENVAFTVSEVSSLAADGITYQTSKLKIGFDTIGLDKKIRDFVSNFNALNKEMTRLTRYGGSDLEEDGALAGDFMIRGIQQTLANVVGSAVGSSSLGTIFQLGVEFNDDGDLEIGSSDKYGFGSGEDRLKKALEENFDQIANLFTDKDNGIATKLYSFVKEYTSFSGLLASRERSVRDQKDQLADEREQFELRMLTQEQILRDKYLNLDQTVAKLNATSSALIASLGS